MTKSAFTRTAISDKIFLIVLWGWHLFIVTRLAKFALSVAGLLGASAAHYSTGQILSTVISYAVLWAAVSLILYRCSIFWASRK